MFNLKEIGHFVFLNTKNGRIQTRWTPDYLNQQLFLKDKNGSVCIQGTDINSTVVVRRPIGD